MSDADRLRPWRVFTWVAYLCGLGGLLAFTPIFNVGMSVAGFTIVGAWLIDWVLDIIEGRTWSRFRCLRQHRTVHWILVIFALHAAGMLWTTDFSWGLHDLRIKLPLLFIPIVIGSMPRVNLPWFHRLMHVFLAAVFFSTFTCMWVVWGWVDKPYDDIREITHLFITRVSHVRLSLLIALALAYAGIQGMRHAKRLVIFIPLGLWLLYFLWATEAVTGLGMTAVVLGFFLLRLVWLQVVAWLRISAVIGLMALITGGTLYVQRIAADYFQLAEGESSALESHTANGEAYFFDLENGQLENGHYVWRYIAWGELASSWSERSHLAFEGSDERGQPVKSTLIRYLTSKGLRKDRTGVEALSASDIQRIEQGVASATEGAYGGLNKRIRQVLLEFDIYRNGGNPGGNSVTQRLEFWRTGWAIVQEHPLLGVGTGDVPEAYRAQYQAMQSPLAEEHRLRTHNQYLTMAIAFGIPGFLLFMASLILPAYREKLWSNSLYLAFAIIAGMSFMTEDTLETQAGVTFFALFQCLLILGVQWTTNGSAGAPPSTSDQK